MSGALAGAQGALLSFLVIVLPTMAAYVATSADPANSEVGWPRAASVGAALWLLGHGGALVAGGATVTLVPLGLSALALFASYASARRTARHTRSAWFASLGGYLLVTFIALLVAGGGGPLGASGTALIRLAVGTVLVAGLGGGLGIFGRRRIAQAVALLVGRLPRWSRLAARAGVMAASCLVVLACGVTITWLVLGRAATDDVVAALDLDVVGGVVLGVAQLVLLPNLVLWALGWVVGPGFAVGEGTLFSPGLVTGGPMPALPLLGALPAESGGLLRAVPMVLVLLGAAAGWWWHRRRECAGAWQPFVAALVMATSGGVVVGGLSLLAGGAAGPGRLSVVGAPVFTVAMTAALLLLLGAVAVTVPSEPAFRAAVARVVRAALSGERKAPQPADDGTNSDDQSGTRDVKASS